MFAIFLTNPSDSSQKISRNHLEESVSLLSLNMTEEYLSLREALNKKHGGMAAQPTYGKFHKFFVWFFIENFPK